MNQQIFNCKIDEKPLDNIKENCGFAAIFKDIGVIGGLALIISIVVVPFIPSSMFGYFYLCLTIPGLIGATIVIFKFVGETKGLDLSKVTGKEWDKKDVKNESTNI